MMTSREMSAGYRSGDLDPVAVVNEAVKRIEHFEPTVNAMWDINEAAVHEAEASRDRWAKGEQLSDYDGVPVTVKENVARAGVPMPSGTAAIEPRIPTSNAPIVDRLSEAGAIVMGSTVMPDWGMLSSGVSSIHGITRNPANPALTTGGSSAGAGAAAVAGYGAAHVGTDIGGSIRLPGTWLGLATLKPSNGLVALDAPYRGRAAGPIARTVTDLVDMMAIIAKPDPRDITALPPDPTPWGVLSFDLSQLRVGWHTTAGAGLETEPETAAAIEAAVDLFASAGAAVQQVEPYMDQKILDDQDLFWRVRSLRDVQALSDEARERVLPFILNWVNAANGQSAKRLMECYGSSLEIAHRAARSLDGFDLILSPTAPMAAFPAEYPMPWGHDDQGMAHIAYTVGANMAGQPASTVNCGFTSDGRPIGLHIVGHRYADRQVLAATHWYEQSRPAEAVPTWQL